jgi:hypothetical protein
MQLFERVFRIMPGQIFLYAFSGSKLTLMVRRVNGVNEKISRIIVTNFIGAKKLNFIFLTKPSKFETISTFQTSKD